MKNFMKLFIVAAVFAMATESFSQTFGVRAGFNLSSAIMKDNTDRYDDNFKMKPGFHLGATAEFPINDIFAFETGLLLSNKGIKESDSESGYNYTNVTNLYYFDVPLTGKAYYTVGGVKIYGLFGPYLAVGLSGKSKTQVTGIPDDTYTIKWGTDSENDDLKRLDMGLAFGAGVELNAFEIGLSYNLGLKNISPYTGDGYKINNRVLGISVGYKFSGK
jgi:Outer membrane protein beta-barrel domain